MASIDLAAAPVGAAIVPGPTAGSRPAAAGFDQALADAQLNAADDDAGSDADSGGAQAETAARSTSAAAPAVSRDARLPAWLALAWFTQGSAAGANTLAAGSEGSAETAGTDEESEPAESSGDAVLGDEAVVVPVVLPTMAAAAERASPGSDSNSFAGQGGREIAAGTPQSASLAEETAFDVGSSARRRAAGHRTEPQPAGTAAGSGGQVRDAAGQGEGATATLSGAASSAEADRLADRRHTGPNGEPAAGSEPGAEIAAGRTRAGGRGAAATREVAGRFQTLDAAAAPIPAPSRSWVDSSEPPPPARPGSREHGVPVSVVTAAPTPASSVSVAQTTAVPAPAAMTSLDGEAVEALQSQIIQTMRLQHQGSGGEARIRLQPHYLGDLAISLKVEQGTVTAHLTASQPEVRQWIEANEAMLRQHLGQHDLTLARLTVTEEEAPEPQRRGGEDEGRRERPPQPRRRRPDTDATFEVVV